MHFKMIQRLTYLLRTDAIVGDVPFAAGTIAKIAAVTNGHAVLGTFRVDTASSDSVRHIISSETKGGQSLVQLA